MAFTGAAKCLSLTMLSINMQNLLSESGENQGKEETEDNSLHLSGDTGQFLGAPVPSTAEMQWDYIWKQNSLTAQFVKN